MEVVVQASQRASQNSKSQKGARKDLHIGFNDVSAQRYQFQKALLSCHDENGRKENGHKQLCQSLGASEVYIFY